MTYKTQGAKYDRTLCFNDIVKLIRTEIKATYNAKEYKFSIRKDHYNHISVEIKKIPFQISNLEWVKAYRLIGTPQELPLHLYKRYSVEAKELLDNIKSIVDQYNYDDSDAMTDYFNTNYYSNIHYDYSLENLERDSIEA